MPHIFIFFSLLTLISLVVVTETTSTHQNMHKIKLFRSSSIGSLNHHRRCISSLPTAFVHHKSTSIHQTTKIKPSTHTHIAKPSSISHPNYCRSMSSIFQSTLTTTNHIESNERTSASTNIIIDELNPSQREATLRPRYSITRVIAGPGAGSKYLCLCFVFIFFCLYVISNLYCCIQ